MAEFTFEELADMHLMYGLAEGNAAEARRFYADRYVNRKLFLIGKHLCGWTDD